MSAAIKFSFDPMGVPEVKAALEGVKLGVQNRVIKAALRKLASIGLKAAKSNLRRRRTGQLRKSLGLRPRTYKRNAVHLIVIGSRRGFRTQGDDGKNIDPTKYSHLLERGRQRVVSKKAGKLTFMPQSGKRVFVKSVRAFAGDPFLEPAIPVLRRAADTQFKADVLAGLQREAAKYAAKGKSIYAGASS